MPFSDLSIKKSTRSNEYNPDQCESRNRNHIPAKIIKPTRTAYNRNIASNRPLPHGRRARGRVHGGLPSLPSQPAPTGYRRGKTRKHHNVSPASRAWISSCRNLPHGSAKLRRYPSSSTSGQKNNPPRSQGKPAETGMPTSVGFASRPCSPPRDSAPATSPRLSSPGERL